MGRSDHEVLSDKTPPANVEAQKLKGHCPWVRVEAGDKAVDDLLTLEALELATKSCVEFYSYFYSL